MYYNYVSQLVPSVAMCVTDGGILLEHLVIAIPVHVTIISPDML